MRVGQYLSLKNAAEPVFIGKGIYQGEAAVGF